MMQIAEGQAKLSITFSLKMMILSAKCNVNLGFPVKKKRFRVKKDYNKEVIFDIFLQMRVNFYRSRSFNG